MGYRDSRGFVDTHDNQKSFNEKYIDNDPGPYLATVKYTEDPQKMGRLGVNIPSLTGTNKPTAEQITWCQYLSPFYGVKPLRAVSATDPYNYTDSQTSYGMWAVPPDIDTTVMVIFAKGDGGRPTAFWMGCVQEPNTNQQIPGHGSTTETSMPANAGDAGPSKEDEYGTSLLPAGEKNRRVSLGVDLEVQSFPINERLADQLLKQGLVADQIRGTTTSSARRESPSAVFGISTPGRLKPDGKATQLGLENSAIKVDRDHGHSFVMDDGAKDGSNQLTRIRTSSGHQLLMHDTDGIVYIANGSGNSWIEMNRDGRIDVYSGVGGINLRTQGDFNLHSDANINMHASGQIRMSSKNEMVQSAGTYMMNLGEKGIFNSSQKGSIRDYARDGLSSFTPGTQLHGSTGVFHLAGSEVHFNSTVASETWGPKWLDTDSAGITIRQEGDVELAKKGIEPLRAFTKQTETTVHRFVTHEPMPRLQGFSAQGNLPFGSRQNLQEWYRASSTPGTVEYTEQRNRLSGTESIRLGQFQADAEKYLKEQMGTSTDATKARQLLAEFGKQYDQAFKIKEQATFDLKDSITSKLADGFQVSDSAAAVLNNTKKLADQVVSNLTQSEAVAMFKDNVFVNQAGELFALGDTTQLYSGDFKGFATSAASKSLANTALETGSKIAGDLTKRKVIGTDKFGNPIYKGLGVPKEVGGIDVSGITGNIGIANIASAGDLKATTNVFKNVVAGQVTSAVTKTAISAVKSQAAGFVAGLGGASARDIAMGGGTATGFASIGVKIGAMALPKLLGGGTVGKAVSRVFSRFSDRRLKDEIRLIGRSPSGINIYSFKYYGIPGRYMGVMAQEVPWATHMTDTGYYAVDYSKVDVEFRRLH